MNKMQNNHSEEIQYQYPIGRSQLESLGFIMFASAMATSSLFVISQGVLQIVTGVISGHSDSLISNLRITEDPKLLYAFHWYGVAVLGATILIKLVLYLYCRKYSHSPAVQAYTIDHINDVIASIASLIAVLVSQWVWWFDPAGAVIVSCFFILNWMREAWDHVTKITGRNAPKIAEEVEILCKNYELIQQLISVRAWHSGNKVHVHIKICINSVISLKEVQNLSEDIQNAVLNIKNIERCYITPICN
jgi:divalent metal cation (Fe/Co/Zn/Cd) transporter